MLALSYLIAVGDGSKLHYVTTMVFTMTTSGNVEEIDAVSYTHLTLPTKRIV